MAVGKLGEYPFQRSFPEYGRTGLDTEPVAVFPYCGHFIVIQIDNLSVATFKRLPALLENVRTDSRSLLFLPCQNLKCQDVLCA